LDTARTANALGRLCYLLGDYARSRELLDFAWKQQQKLNLSSTHRAQLRVLFNIGVLNREEGVYDEALEILERVSSIERKVGERSNDYLLCQIELAKLKNDCGQPQEAVEILEKVREIQKTDLVPEQLNCIRATIFMTQSLLSLGKVSKAEEVLSEIESIWKSLRVLTPHHPEELAINVTTASLRLHQNRGKECLENLNATIGWLESTLDKRHRYTIMAKFLLGQIYLQMNRVVEGLDQIQTSTAELIRSLGNDHPEVRRFVALETKYIAEYEKVSAEKGSAVVVRSS
jgi:tetratricopeptide (TPR) repeat protein